MSTEAMKLALEALNSFPHRHLTPLVSDARTALREALAQPQQEPVACQYAKDVAMLEYRCVGRCQYDTSSPAKEFVCSTGLCHYRKPLAAREIELIDGMIEVQLDHAARCDNIANRVMAEKQKGWDMDRVELLRKLKGDA